MHIRKFEQGDTQQLWALFYNTIHRINIRDYNEAQVAAWAPRDIDMNFVARKFRDINPYVVVEEGVIIGYADIQADGYIDHFYCHHEHQGRGVGRMLFKILMQEAKDRRIQYLYSNVSVTARPFFEVMGFSVEKEQLVPVGDQLLRNYRMSRDFNCT